MPSATLTMITSSPWRMRAALMAAGSSHTAALLLLPLLPLTDVTSSSSCLWAKDFSTASGSLKHTPAAQHSQSDLHLVLQGSTNTCHLATRLVRCAVQLMSTQQGCLCRGAEQVSQAVTG